MGKRPTDIAAQMLDLFVSERYSPHKNAPNESGGSDVEDFRPDAVPSGYAAIEAALGKAYPGIEAIVMHAPIPRMLGGKQALDDIYVYMLNNPPHWTFVTAGLSELYDKESDDPAVSGQGFELVLRVRRDEADTLPPNWAINFLQNVGRYVIDTGNSFIPGDTMDLNGPMRAGADTQIVAIAIRTDPLLGEIASLNGKLEFRQIAGITRDELWAMKSWQTDGVLAELTQQDPLLMVDLMRKSALSDSAVSQRISQRAEVEGSTTDMLLIGQASYRVIKHLFRVDSVEVTWGAYSIVQVATVMRGRIPFGRSLILYLEDNRNITLIPKDRPCVECTPETLTIGLTKPMVDSLLKQLQPKQKEIVLPELPMVVFKISKSFIKDPDGKVVQIVG